jgi:hypothetical protein
MIDLDGRVVNSNSLYKSSGGNRFDNALYTGQIIGKKYVNEIGSIGKKRVEYSAILFTSRQNIILNGCRMVDTFGSENNFNEVIVGGDDDKTASTRAIKNNETNIRGASSLELRNGAIVLISFLEGNRNKPIILGCLQHPSIDPISETNLSKFSSVGSSKSRDVYLDFLPLDKPGAYNTDGERILGEYNGVRWNINKEGEFTLYWQGLKDDLGLPKDATHEKHPTVLKINKDGEFLILDRLDQEIKISNKTGKILISDGNINPSKIEIDRINQAITLSAQEDANLHSENNLNITTKSQSSQINGDCKESIGGAWTVNVTGNASIKSTGTLTLQGARVKIN